MLKSEHVPLVFAIGLTSVATIVAFSIQPLAGLIKPPETISHDGYQCICPPQSNYLAVALSGGLLVGLVYIIKRILPDTIIKPDNSESIAP